MKTVDTVQEFVQYEKDLREKYGELVTHYLDTDAVGISIYTLFLDGERVGQSVYRSLLHQNGQPVKGTPIQQSFLVDTSVL